MLRDEAITWALSVPEHALLEAQQMHRDQEGKPGLKVGEGTNHSCNSKQEHVNLLAFPLKQWLRA